ncbi:MAG: hypothetical protein AAF944_10840 [Bacteroidota bacterium]
MKSIIEPNQLSLSYLMGWEIALVNFDRWIQDRTATVASARKYKSSKRE